MMDEDSMNHELVLFYNRTISIIPRTIYTKEEDLKINFVGENIPNVYISENVLPIDFAKKIRLFLEQITENSSDNHYWENYKGFQRLSIPTNDSPIYDLIDIFDQKWKYFWKIKGVDILKKTKWVIQRTKKEQFINPHTDKYTDRNVCFIYYLSADDWKEEDGGILQLCDGKNLVTKLPIFNTMICWDMINNESVLHWVTKLKNDKSRICLVGFFS